MTINVEFNGIPLTVEYKSDFVKAAYHRGHDIFPIFEASTGLYGELLRLVKEAHKKEYGE